MSIPEIQQNPLPPYQQPVDAVIAALGTDARRGLSEAEARARLERHGRNELTAEKPVPAWRKFLAQFKDVAGDSAAHRHGHFRRAVAVSSANRPCPTKRSPSSPSCCSTPSWATSRSRAPNRRWRRCARWRRHRRSVIRDGERRSVPAAEIVPGDLILIEEGDTIPADARLIHSTALQTAEAALTGESLPVSKDIAPVAGEAGLGDRTNMVFSGTAATYGRGKAVVTATGMQTEMGRIAGMLKEARAETTPLQKELDRVGKRLGIVVVIIAVVMIATIILVEDVRGLFGALRRADPGRGAGGRRGAGRLAGGGDGRACPGRAAHGQAERHRASSRGGRNARLGQRHRFRQDRHADQERNDGARPSSPPAGGSSLSGTGYAPEGRGPGGRRRPTGGRAPRSSWNGR